MDRWIQMNWHVFLIQRGLSCFASRDFNLRFWSNASSPLSCFSFSDKPIVIPYLCHFFILLPLHLCPSRLGSFASGFRGPAEHSHSGFNRFTPSTLFCPLLRRCAAHSRYKSEMVVWATVLTGCKNSTATVEQNPHRLSISMSLLRLFLCIYTPSNTHTRWMHTVSRLLSLW